MGVEHWWNDSDSKIEVLQENPLPTALCPPQILRLTAGIEPGYTKIKNASQVSLVRGQQLIV